MNIKHIIRKVLNENTNPIIKLLNKRGIDPIKDLDNTLDFLENTLGLDSNEITDLYKSILGDNITENTYFDILDNMFHPEDLTLNSYTSNTISFIGKNGGIYMSLYYPGSFPDNKYLDDLCPLLDFNYRYRILLKRLFGDDLKEPFKKWINKRFGLNVKTIQ